jgi:PAS domain S-box-containing protein
MNQHASPNETTSDSVLNDLKLAQAEIKALQDQVASMEGLEQEREMFHQLLDFSRDAIYFKDLKSRYLRVSRCHPSIQYTGSPEKAIGKTDFDYFPIEHAQEAYNDEMRIIQTGEPILGIIERETAPGMPEKWVFTSKLPMRDKNGEIVGTFGISRDITEIKRFENELQRAKDELEERVRLRTRDLQLANAGLEQRIAQLDFLTSATYEMAQCIGLDELANVIARVFSSRFTNAITCLCIKSAKPFSFIGSSAHLDETETTSFIEYLIPHFHADTLTRPAILTDWTTRLPGHIQPGSLAQLPCYIAIPLLADNRHIGVVQLFAETGTDERFKEEEKVILTLAAHAAVSLSNALYYKELGEKAQLQGELEAARSIQQRLTPRSKPSIPRVSLKGLYSPAYEVGGDYLDYFKNDAGCWVVVIADVCGKGIPAALLMTMLRSSFRAEASSKTSAKDLLCAVNTGMLENLDERSFVTAICLIINTDGTAMSYARAGHPRLIRILAGGNRVETLESEGIALGILSDPEEFAGTVTELTVPLIPGDRFIIYTDGLTEAFNPQKNTYGTNRLLDLITNGIGSTPEEMIGAITGDIRQYTQGAPYHDDLTVIAMSVDAETPR